VRQCLYSAVLFCFRPSGASEASAEEYNPEFPEFDDSGAVPVGASASDFLFDSLAEDTNPGDLVDTTMGKRWRTALNVDGQGAPWNPNAAAAILARRFNPGTFPLPRPNLQVVKYGPSPEMLRLHKLSHAIGSCFVYAMHNVVMFKEELVALVGDNPQAAARINARYDALLKSSAMMTDLREGLAMTADVANTVTQVRRAELFPTDSSLAPLQKFLAQMSPSYQYAFYEKELAKVCPETDTLVALMNRKIGVTPAQPFRGGRGWQAAGYNGPAASSGNDNLPPAVACLPRFTPKGEPIKNMRAYYGVVNDQPTRLAPPSRTTVRPAPPDRAGPKPKRGRGKGKAAG
jgi:hypothetical protein